MFRTRSRFTPPRSLRADCRTVCRLLGFERLGDRTTHRLERSRQRPRLEALEGRIALTVTSSFHDSVTAVALDEAGNLYAAGVFRGMVDFDPGPGQVCLEGGDPNSSYWIHDSFLAKYTPGGDLVWARKTLDAPGDPEFLGSYTDGLGVSYAYVYHKAQPESVLAKYDGDGTLLWETSEPWGFFPNGGFAVDAAGSLYFAGDFTGTVDFDGDPLTTSDKLTSNGTDAFVAKLDSDGVFAWVAQVGGASTQSVGGGAGGNGTTIAVSGPTVFLAGEFTGSLSPGDLNDSGSIGQPDGFLLQLDATDGSQVSAFSHADRTWNAVAIDGPDGSAVYLRGGSYASAQGVVLARVSASTGGLAWIESLPDPGDGGTPIVTVSEGWLYIVGHFFGTVDFDPGPGLYNLSAAGSSDAYVMRLRADDGSFAWARQLGGTAWYSNFEDYGSSITTGGGAVYTGGSFTSRDSDFDPGTGTAFLNADGDHDGFVSKLTTDGAYLWARQIGNQTRTIDDGDTDSPTDGDTLSDYIEIGTGWKRNVSGGYQFDGRYHAKGNGSNKARWTFSGLSPGAGYEVRATWNANSKNATNAVFKVGGVAVAPINQRVAPDDYQNDQNSYSASRTWERLGSGTFAASASGTLIVELSDLANGNVVADAIRIVFTQPAAAPLRVQMLPATEQLAIDGPAEVRPDLTAPLRDWRPRGADVARLAPVRIEMADLGGDRVAQASGSTITHDDNAADWGWTLGKKRGRVNLQRVLVH